MSQLKGTPALGIAGYHLADSTDSTSPFEPVSRESVPQLSDRGLCDAKEGGLNSPLTPVLNECK